VGPETPRNFLGSISVQTTKEVSVSVVVQICADVNGGNFKKCGLLENQHYNGI
jgi:hypothetical protein